MTNFNFLDSCTALFAVLFLPALAAGQDFPLKRVPQLTYVVDYEASWSPDGRQIVLISNRHGGMKVHLLDAASKETGIDMRQITTGPNEDDSPVWSPNGKQIAFVSIHEDISDIFVMDTNGKNVKQLTRNMGQNIHPAWSPDGSRILFNSTHGGEPLGDGAGSAPNRKIGEQRDNSMNLVTIRPDGSDLERITRDGGYTYACFSPDGKLIVHRRQQGDVSQIFVMNADGSGDRNLSGSNTVDGWPSWSPDGKRIVFSRHVNNGFQVFVMNLDGTGVRQLTDAAGEFVNPRWSPDGTKILCGRRAGGVTLVVFPTPK